MKIKNKVKAVCTVAGLLSLLASGTAFAGWSNVVSIASVTSWPDAQTYLEFTTTPSGKPGCATTGIHQIIGTAEHIEAASKIATAAFLAGRQVKVYFDTTCTGGDGKITHITMY